MALPSSADRHEPIYEPSQLEYIARCAILAKRPHSSSESQGRGGSRLFRGGFCGRKSDELIFSHQPMHYRPKSYLGFALLASLNAAGFKEEAAMLLDDYKVLQSWTNPNKPSASSGQYSRSDDTSLPHIGPDGQGWPNDKMPLEIFEAIGEYLSRESLQNFRLSCRDFERNASLILFKTVVVPSVPEF